MLKMQKKIVKEKTEEIQEIISKAREASASAGAAIFTEDFVRECNNLRNTAKIWLWITGILAAVSLLASIGMWLYTEPGLDGGQLWQKIAT